jgi:hypothetical protein
MKKVALFAFNGDAVCFIHVLLNGMDVKTKSYDVKIVIEGAATRLIPELNTEENPFFALFRKARDNGIIDGVCRDCSAKMGTINDAEAMGLVLLDHMSGHPGMSRCRDAGYDVITF